MTCSKTSRALVLGLGFAAAVSVVWLPAGSAYGADDGGTGESGAMGVASAILNGRHAIHIADFMTASDILDELMTSGHVMPEILTDALMARVGIGDMDSALEIAGQLEARGEADWLAYLCLFVGAVGAGDFYQAAKHLDAYSETIRLENLIWSPSLAMTRDEVVWSERNRRTLELVLGIAEGLLRGWTDLGKGRMTLAIDSFDSLGREQDETEPDAEVAEPVELTVAQVIGLYHKMLALAHVGDFEAAEAIGNRIAEHDDFMLNRGATEAWAQILLQTDQVGPALSMLDRILGARPNPKLSAFRDRIEAGELPDFDFVTSAGDGIAEVMYLVAENFPSRSSERVRLAHARMATHLNGQFSDAILATAEILLNLEQFELAEAAFDRVDAADPRFIDAEIGRSDTLFESGDVDGAIAVLRTLARSHPDVFRVHTSLGDALRYSERYDEASAAYDRAVELTVAPGRSSWFLFYARGITHERADRWDEAEADFRFALSLSPDEPLVLNYLGYSLIEKGIKMDEARSMIEEAVSQRPNEGYIVDSLGWVLYRQGEFEDAVIVLERAVALSPAEPVINDHLGDAYWMVGRRREAEIQWKRSLSLEPEVEDAERIRRKLAFGLDSVLEEETSVVESASDDP